MARPLVPIGLVVGFALAGCTFGAAPPQSSEPSQLSVSAGPATMALAPSLRAGVTAADLATGLHTPWGIGLLPDGTALVTDRDSGAVRTIGTDGTVGDAGSVDGVEHDGEGGLLGLAVSPAFATDRTVFVYFTTAGDNRVARLTVTDRKISDQKPILTGLPKAANHDGGRLAFGPDKLLYIGTGDARNRDGAQDLGYLGGKILRINPDGTGAQGNPFAEAPLVYSYGHRNVQGLAFDASGRLWASEFGQDTWDELNLITSGGNYGWPIVEGSSTDPKYVAPQREWATSDASPSGIAIWRGSVWMAGLAGRTLWQIPIIGSCGSTGKQTSEPIAHLRGEFGRLRTVVVTPDDQLWVSTSNTDGRGDPAVGDDRILRVSAD